MVNQQDRLPELVFRHHHHRGLGTPTPMSTSQRHRWHHDGPGQLPAHAASPSMSMVQGKQPHRSPATVRIPLPTSASSTTRHNNANTTPPRHSPNDRDVSAPRGYYASPSTVPIIDLTAEDWSSQPYDVPASYARAGMVHGSALRDPPSHSTAHGTTTSAAPAPETAIPVFHWTDFDWDALPE